MPATNSDVCSSHKGTGGKVGVAQLEERGRGCLPVASLNGWQQFFDVWHMTMMVATSLVPENGWGVSQAGH